MYDRHKPYLAALKEIYRLNGEGSQKETYHIVLQADIPFTVGDSIGILPSHDPKLVQKTLDALKATGAELIQDKRSGETRTILEHLKAKANITKVHSSLLNEMSARMQNEEKKKWIQELTGGTHHDALTNYLHSFELWDFLQEHKEVEFTPQEIVDFLPPLLPRFYSIASSAKMHPDEIHLTVATTDFVSNGIERKGVGTHFLCRLATVGKREIPIYIQPSNGFTLPETHLPIIMVGPGTGIAPFRAFLQERYTDKALGKNWLFFGERNKESDFFYKDFWHELEKAGNFRLDCAFSRDQEHKVYVQHKMKERASELWKWLQEGAIFYVCGDAHKMAKDVDHTLFEIIKHEGNLTDEETKAYIKALKKSKRYLRDVY